jgi:hypothetical protein
MPVNPESALKYGQRRALMDKISMLVENENPVQALLPKGGKPKSTLYEWPIDKEVAPRDNAVPDGHDFSEYENHSKDYGILRNRIQLMQRGSMVTTLMQEVSDVAGVPDIIGREKMKAMKAIVADMEAAITSDNEMKEATGTQPGEGGRMRGMGTWMSSSAQAVEPVPAGYRMDAGQIVSSNLGAFTEAAFKTIMQKNFEMTGQRRSFMGVMGATAKAHVDGFASRSTATTNIPAYTRTWERSAKERSLGDIVDRLESSFGSVNLIVSNRLAVFSAAGHATRRVYIFSPDNWELCLLRPATLHNQTDNGGGPRFFYDAIVGLKCFNPLSGGKVAVTADS